MGEIVDDHINRMLDGGGWFSFSRPLKQPQCNRCGSKHVYWRKTKQGHRLMEIGNGPPHDTQHTCPTTPDGFEDVPE